MAESSLPLSRHLTESTWWRHPRVAWFTIAVVTICATGITAALTRAPVHAAAVGVQAGCVTSLLWLALHDLATYRLPLDVMAPSLALMLLAAPLWPERSLLFAPLGAASFAGAMLVFYIIGRGKGLGEGDVIMAALAGALLGPGALMLFLFGTYASGGIYSLMFMLSGHGRNTVIPYGPFLAIGTLTALWWPT